MEHQLYRVTSFALRQPYTIDVRFDDGAERSIDFEPVLHGELFAPLRDPELFRKVAIDPEVHTLVWPNGADFDPATLHDWPQVVSELTERARKWEIASARGSAAN